MLRDFNLSALKWSTDDMFLNYVTQNDVSIFNAFASAGLTQVIGEGTSFPSGNVLDLYLVLDLDRDGLTRKLPPLPGNYHCTILLEYAFQTQCAVINNDGQPDRL